MRTIQCRVDGCENEFDASDVVESARCLACADGGQGPTYAQQQARSYHADAHRRNLVNYGRCKR